MDLMDLEYRAGLADAVPADALDEACDVTRETSRTVESAQSRRLDTRAQEPEESADVIHVRVAHKDVAHLVGDFRREPPAVPEIEQQAAPALPQADMQQWITEQAVDQQCAGDAEVNEAGRVGVFALRCR